MMISVMSDNNNYNCNDNEEEEKEENENENDDDDDDCGIIIITSGSISSYTVILHRLTLISRIYRLK